jgi:CubicO group peptidase (beta-lactamase class C family)
MRRYAISIALSLLLLTPLAARQDKTDEFIKAQLREQNIPGLALAVVKNGTVLKAEGYGYADLERKIPMASSTVLKIASVSKQFIATGIMLLVQDGKLSVNDAVRKHISDVPGAWNGITIKHLLTHTAGLVREAPGTDISKFQPDIDVIRKAYDAPLHFAPGEKYQYSNVGYFILGEIIRRTSGRPWADYIVEKVFTPSGMISTFPTNSTATIANRAIGYVDNDDPRRAPEWTALRPSGGFLSTVLDMAKWDAMLYTDTILTAASRREMWTPVRLNDGTTAAYGYGWQVTTNRGRTRVFHGGGGPGARASFTRFLEDKLSFIVLINTDDVDIDTIVQGLAASYLPPQP